MLSQVLPGLRELRGPLAAGFLWLLFGWLVLHHDVAEAHGKVKDLRELGETLSPAALAVAASFVAYLLGALSEDATRQLLRRLVRRFLPGRMHERIYLEVGSAEASLEEMTEGFRETQISRIENDVDRTKAELDLRLGILPPLCVVLIFLAIDETPIWLVGFVFILALGAQAAIREADFQIANGSLIALRRQAGVPPSSAEEVRVSDEQRDARASVRLGALDHAAKGDRLLQKGNIGQPEMQVWMDDASTFIRENGTEDDAAQFLSITGSPLRQTVDEQVELLRKLAAKFEPPPDITF